MTNQIFFIKCNDSSCSSTTNRTLSMHEHHDVLRRSSKSKKKYVDLINFRNAPSKHGLLYVSSQHQWKKKYFRLHNNVLRFYGHKVTKDDHVTAPDGVIPLDGASVQLHHHHHHHKQSVIQSMTKKGMGTHKEASSTFILVSCRRRYVMRAGTPESAQAWIEKIEEGKF